ncbi:related to transposase [Sporisorium reilianum SRZ2]|uniref:Related to transposase n=1 Tax=Sporisorium reilianum (strain SRZ2) TaxID=999809 RepID=E7A182_SPORE|nr:related to transposase [Sporisorium reilianum SRZ2]
MPPKRGKMLSLETRSKLVQAVNEQRLTVAEAARRFMVPESTARSFLKHHASSSRIKAKKQGGNRHPVLNDEHLQSIQEQLDNKADLRVSDIQQKIQEAFNFKKPPSASTINRAINNKLHYTLKWAQRFSDSGARMFNAVYIDETGFNLHSHITYGRAKIGMSAIKSVTSDRGKNTTYMAAIGQEEVITNFVHQGSTTNMLYASFLKTKVFPKLTFPCCIIMDNAQFHKTKLIRDTFAESTHQAVYLPPYSPFLNTAEWLFAHVKPRLSKEEYKDPESLFNAICRSANSVTGSHFIGWIREVNRNLHRAMNGEVLGREYDYNMAEGDEDLAGELLADLENLRVLA